MVASPSGAVYLLLLISFDQFSHQVMDLHQNALNISLLLTEDSLWSLCISPRDMCTIKNNYRIFLKKNLAIILIYF
jgi:hypothetical protein